MNIDEDDTKLFRLLEPGEFGIYTQSDELPVSDCPVYLMEGVGGICLSGTATVQVFSHRFRIVRGMVLALFPWQLISIKEVSDDFGIRFFRISHDMFTDTLSSLWRARPGFFFYMRTHIASEPREEYVGRFLNFCDLLAYRAENAPVICRRESVMQLLRVFYWDVYTIYLNDPQAEKTAYTHKEELAFRFMRTVVEEHSPNRDVAYFAERLGITPKYLTNMGTSPVRFLMEFTCAACMSCCESRVTAVGCSRSLRFSLGAAMTRTSSTSTTFKVSRSAADTLPAVRNVRIRGIILYCFITGFVSLAK